MKKFFAVVKIEYKKIVLKWAFLIGTLLFPVIAAGFAIVPAIIFSIKGEPTRIIVVDKTGKIAPRLKQNLSAEKLREKAKRAAEGFSNISGSQEEKLKRNTEQFEQTVIFCGLRVNRKNRFHNSERINQKNPKREVGCLSDNSRKLPRSSV